MQPVVTGPNRRNGSTGHGAIWSVDRRYTNGDFWSGSWFRAAGIPGGRKISKRHQRDGDGFQKLSSRNQTAGDRCAAKEAQGRRGLEGGNIRKTRIETMTYSGRISRCH